MHDLWILRASGEEGQMAGCRDDVALYVYSQQHCH